MGKDSPFYRYEFRVYHNVFQKSLFLQEFLKSSADIIDVIGLHLLMTNFLAGKGEVRFVVGGLGWGFAHSIAHRLVLLWVGARGTAFTWRWIQVS